jgi:hypothetical protein
MPHRHRLEGLLMPLDDHDRPQSSSASLVTAGALGFFARHRGCSNESAHASMRASCSSALLDGPPASRDHQRMDPTVCELVLLALLSAFLCGVALIYAQPIATAVFAALTSGCVVIAAGLSRGSWT